MTMDKSVERIIIILLLLSIFLAGYSVIEEQDKSDLVVIEVMPGDTIWSYAKQYNQYTNLPVSSFVEWVEKENAIYYGEIHPGDLLTLPIERSAVAEQGNASSLALAN